MSIGVSRDPMRCWNPKLLYKPQYAYPIPSGYRDETFLVPFKFTNPGTGALVRGFPWSLDDDVPYLLHGLYFPQIAPFSGPAFSPGYARIWDTHGNPLSDDLVLALGMLSMGGLWQDPQDFTRQKVFAWGFPFEPYIECAPGGTLLFDFQLDTNAVVAAFFHAGIVAGINFTAGLWGLAGNVFTIQLINPGAANIPLSVAVVGGVNVQVTLATNGAAAIISTFGDVANLLNTSPVTVGKMGATIFPPASEVITAFGPSALSGGAASTPFELDGVLIGKKRFKAC